MNTQIAHFAHILTKPWKQFLSPDDLNQVEECSVPRHFSKKELLNNKEQKVKVSFLGDITNVVSDNLSIGKELKKSLDLSQYIVVNLESTPFNYKGFSLSKNYVSKEFLQNFVDMFPTQKIIFGLANNHSFDYGDLGLRETIKAIEEVGATYVGTGKKPFIYLAPTLRLDAHTLLKIGDESKLSNSLTDSLLNETDQVVKYLHWGEEFEEMPTDSQVLEIEALEQPILVCGHHGHCPQPIQYSNRTLCAYSLGDFISQHKPNAPERGIHLQIEFSKGQKWEIATTDWDFIGQSKKHVDLC